MLQKETVRFEVKVKASREYLSGAKSLCRIAKEIGVSFETVRRWTLRYKSEGVSAFLPSEEKRSYSPELKKQAVEAYLSGKGSMQDIIIKYKIRSDAVLQRWIKVYNSGKDFKHKMTGGSRMKTRKTTQEERIEIAKACIENGKNYEETALRYQVSYQQVYTWTKKYEELGEAGLEDRRGQRIINQEPRTEEEMLRQKIAELERKNYILEVENELLKKLDELERGQRYRK